MKQDSVQKILLAECSSFNKKGFDTDIEHYINLIADRKYKAAAALYQKQLVPRYTDEITRIRIIRYYRKRDPRFTGTYAGAVKDLLERIITSVRTLIDYIISLFSGNNTNAYNLLKKIEKALAVIPAESDKGVRFLKKMEVYSMLISYRVEEFSAASDILQRYFDNTLFVKIEKKTEEKKESPEKHHKLETKERSESSRVTIDLDAVTFTDEEVKAICIDSRITGRAYQVLAWCRLYWRNILNQDFEKKLFLYSKKYNSLHYKIFLIIKNGRIRRIGDDVILLELYSLLSSRYQYSMQEDILMQNIWRRIKPAEEAVQPSPPGQHAAALPGSAAATGSNRLRSLLDRRKILDAAAEKSTVPRKTAEADIAAQLEERVTLKINLKLKPKKSAEKISLPEKQSYPSPYTTAIPLKEKLERLNRGEAFNASVEFENLLPKYIERQLKKNRKPGASADPYVLKGAQFIIIRFIDENSSNLKINWQDSLEKREVSNMGYNIYEIDSIIAACLEEVRMRRAVVF